MTEYGLTISVENTKWMAFQGRDPVRSKILVHNKTIEQVNLFNYLGNMTSYEGELNIDNKFKKKLKITGILNKVFDYKKPLRKQEKNCTINWPFQSCYMAGKLGLLKQVTPEE